VRLFTLALAVLALSGCTFRGLAGDEETAALPRADRVCGPDLQQLPCGSGVVQGAPYTFQLLTHCGIEYAYFDGRYWAADPTLSDGSGNPPAGLDNPVARGTMTLEGDDTAVFRADSGREARFRPAPESFRAPGCA
jgi:hypothetical protein